MVRSGFAVLLVLISLSSILLMCAQLWRSTAYLVDISTYRIAYASASALAHAGLVWSVALCNQDAQAIELYCTNHAELYMHCEQWPNGSLSDRHTISVTLRKDQKNLKVQSCVRTHDAAISVHAYGVLHADEHAYTLSITGDTL